MTDEPDFSAAVSETAKAGQDVDKALGSPMALLLGPTFKLIGEHWGKKAEAYLNPKQVKNLEEKIAIAQEDGPMLLGNDTKPRQIAALVEWTDAAHDVDGVEQPQLSHAWAKALRNISEQNYILLDSLGKLNEDDITTLKNGGILSMEKMTRFVGIGLINDPKSRSLVGYVFYLLNELLLFIIFTALGFTMLLLASISVFGWPLLDIIRPAKWAVLFTLPFSFGFFLVSYVFAFSVWRDVFKRIVIAEISVLGHDIISKLDSDAKPEFSFYKRDLAREKLRSKH